MPKAVNSGKIKNHLKQIQANGLANAIHIMKQTLLFFSIISCTVAHVAPTKNSMADNGDFKPNSNP